MHIFTVNSVKIYWNLTLIMNNVSCLCIVNCPKHRLTKDRVHIFGIIYFFLFSSAQRWKYAILTTVFHRACICKFSVVKPSRFRPAMLIFMCSLTMKKWISKEMNNYNDLKFACRTKSSGWLRHNYFFLQMVWKMCHSREKPDLS